MHARPIYLYKYRAANSRTEAIIENSEIYFSLAKGFNDPYECAFRLSMDGPENMALIQSQVYEAAKEKWPDKDEEFWRGAALLCGSNYREKFSNHFASVLEEKLRTERKASICCFSQHPDSVDMWAHYADEQKGVCLKFRTADKFFDRVKPVRYSDDFPTFSTVKVVNNPQFREASSWMLQKAERWKPECEWRILDFNRGAGLRTFHRSALVGVILGCHVTPATVDRFRVLLKYRATRLFQARLHESRYKIEFDELPK